MYLCKINFEQCAKKAKKTNYWEIIHLVVTLLKNHFSLLQLKKHFGKTDVKLTFLW